MKIIIQTVPPENMRYPTVGDYYEDKGVKYIYVADTKKAGGTDEMNMLIAIHELVEFLLTEHAGIPEPEIMAFDELYETEDHPEWQEPGFDKRSPYRKQHTLATGIELILASELGVGFNEYDEVCNKTWDLTRLKPKDKFTTKEPG